jgi:ABC-type bacteriocin/lantibiotic exporter with double-glycine peptidase domain
MVLATKGYIVSELVLRERCDCNFLGTEALKAVDALRTMGFSNSSKCMLQLPELMMELSAGVYPIVFLNLLPVDSVNDPHAMVVVAIEDDFINVYDPLQGERALPRATFETAWAMMRNLVILVKD